MPVALFETLLADSASVHERKRLNDGLRALDRFSLAALRDAGLDVHRLLQKVVRDQVELRDDDSAILTALQALERLLPEDSALPTWWPQYEALLPHITAIADTAAARCHPDRVVSLLCDASVYLLHLGAGERAVAAGERATALAVEYLDPEDPRSLNARANLASAYRSAGRTGEAIALLERVAADNERLLGPEHPDTLTARANLAASYRSAGRTGEAIAI